MTALQWVQIHYQHLVHSSVLLDYSKHVARANIFVWSRQTTRAKANRSLVMLVLAATLDGKGAGLPATRLESAKRC
ncbi:MAG: hypothetical protein KatS3mg105_0442 [Gemmatales bacterium]|nr:MAG: hypothetical protein KatS3mg105_0442 [Gemmatales bacterium]